MAAVDLQSVPKKMDGGGSLEGGHLHLCGHLGNKLIIILYNRKRGRTGRARGRQRWLDRSGRSGQGVRVVG